MVLVQNQQQVSAGTTRRWPLVVAALVVLAIAYYAFSWYKGVPLVQFNNINAETGLPKDIQDAKDVQDRALVGAQLKGLIQDLPTEEFLLSEVVNENDLRKEQPFYAEVKNGDKIIIFQKAGRAIIFRPATNQVIKDGDFVRTTGAN
jgi:hypothetical protein